MGKSESQGEAFSNRALFERSADPIFVLNPRRRLRYLNAAAERLLRQPLEELYNLNCVRDGRASPLAQALCPPPEALEGAVAQVRRPVPPGRVGPPWWDISFLPLAGADGLLGILGRIAVIGTAPPARSQALPEGLVQLRHRLAQRFAFSDFDSDLPAAQRVVEQARVAASNTAPLMLIGESGTGKRRLARTIHHQGITAERAFVAVDCPGLPPEALGLLLFGPAGLAQPERIGTIYLRDAAELSRELQDRLLGWLKRRSKDGPRIIAGFSAEPTAGGLVAELLCALGVQTIRLLPLRELLADLPRLASAMLKQDGAAAIAADALERLSTYAWPGNLRELTEVLACAAGKAGGGTIEPAHLPEFVRPSATPVPAPAEAARQYPLEAMLKQFERRVILLALRKSRGHKGEAARLLDLSRTELWRRMNQLEIGDDDWRSVHPREPGGDAPPPDRAV